LGAKKEILMGRERGQPKVQQKVQEKGRVMVRVRGLVLEYWIEEQALAQMKVIRRAPEMDLGKVREMAHLTAREKVLEKEQEKVLGKEQEKVLGKVWD
jgi:hypothetical protein